MVKRPFNVMIVDDDMLVREMLSLVFQEIGFSVIAEVGDCQLARNQLQEFAPDLVFLDIHMPGENGLSLLSDIKQHYPEIRVVMMSAEPSSDSVKTSINSGARGFIVKPFNAQSVICAIKRLIPEYFREE